MIIFSPPNNKQAPLHSLESTNKASPVYFRRRKPPRKRYSTSIPTLFPTTILNAVFSGLALVRHDRCKRVGSSVGSSSCRRMSYQRP